MLLSLLLGAIQAITEFLPISSSAHLYLIPWLFNLPYYGLGFDAALHLGTAIALLVFFAKDYWKLFKQRDRLLLYIFIATIPAGLVGFLADSTIERVFNRSSYAPLIIGVGLIIFGILLYLLDKIGSKSKTITKARPSDALIIGLAQILALIPGTSRSGITISAGLGLGFKRVDAARFSFLVGTPITVIAGAYKTYQLLSGNETSNVSASILVISIIFTAIIGIIVIRWFLKYLANHDYKIFVWYRFVIGALMILVWINRL